MSSNQSNAYICSHNVTKLCPYMTQPWWF